MAKNAINEYSTTADENTDIGGVGTNGNNLVSNFDNAFRVLMAQLAKMNGGASPIDATFRFRDPTVTSKKLGFDLSSLSTSQEVIVDAKVLAGVYGKSNILGTVSQSAGVPTGAIIEHGTAASDTIRWTKFADGTITIRGRQRSLGYFGNTTCMETINFGTYTGALIDAKYTITANIVPPNDTDSPQVAASNCAPLLRELTAVIAGAKTTTTVDLAVLRTGSTAFAVGNFVCVDFDLTGRWF